MRRVSLCALALLALAVVASAADPDAGNWSRPVIERLRDAPFTTNYTLYQTGWGNKTVFTWTATEGAEAAVFVRRNPNASAWDVLEFEYSTAMFPTDVEAGEGYYAAGYAEGWLTWDDMYSTWINQVQQSWAQMQTSNQATQFVINAIAFLKAHETNTTFGAQLARQMRFLDGLHAGYNARINNGIGESDATTLSWSNVFLISYQESLADVLSKYDVDSQQTMSTLKRSDLHCSALVRLTSDDLYLSHDTWGGYNTMLRQYKTYTFGGVRVSMSGYAGSFSSIDDFYLTSNNLAITETTNGIMNNSLWVNVKPNQVPEFARVMIANFVATTPQQWFELFSHQNSGTYNNQYMVVNMAAAKTAIAAGQPLPAGTFYVGEQIPGLVVSEDQTDHLNTFGYWASFNIPYYKQIYDLSGFAHEEPRSFGLFSYTNYSRALIFNRMADQVVDAPTMWYLMRYNNWQHDPASRIMWCKQNGGPYTCDMDHASALTIAARFDLGPGPNARDGPDRLSDNIAQSSFGAIDTKMTSATLLMSNMTAYMINGPTNVQQPTFNYTAFAIATQDTEPRRGVPTYFDFAPISVSLGTLAPPPTMAPVPGPGDHGGDDDDDKKKKIAIGVGVAAGVAVVGVVGVVAYKFFSPSSSYTTIGDGEGGRTMV